MKYATDKYGLFLFDNAKVQGTPEKEIKMCKICKQI